MRNETNMCGMNWIILFSFYWKTSYEINWIFYQFLMMILVKNKSLMVIIGCMPYHWVSHPMRLLPIDDLDCVLLLIHHQTNHHRPGYLDEQYWSVEPILNEIRRTPLLEENIVSQSPNQWFDSLSCLWIEPRSTFDRYVHRNQWYGQQLLKD